MYISPNIDMRYRDWYTLGPVELAINTRNFEPCPTIRFGLHFPFIWLAEGLLVLSFYIFFPFRRNIEFFFTRSERQYYYISRFYLFFFFLLFFSPYSFVSLRILHIINQFPYKEPNDYILLSISILYVMMCWRSRTWVAVCN